MSRTTRKSQRRQPAAAAAGPEPRRPQASLGLGKTEFNPDYTHVVTDLRKIGLLAGSLFLVLIVLSFILK